MAFRKVQQFTIAYDKPAYFAGEVMQASVTLVTSEPIECRGVRADVKGEGFCVIGQGDDRKSHRSTYWKETHTLWGGFHRTEEIDDAGENAIFGSPWAPNEGVLHLPIQSATEPLIVRVMDEDYGKRDDLLGEVLIANPERLVQQSQGGAQEVTLPLTLKGKPATHKGNASILVVRAMWVELQGASTPRQLRLDCCRALNLRKADWGLLAKNDVYVQAYHPPPGSAAVDGSKALPKPMMKSILPPGHHTFALPPLKLPDNLPASKEYGFAYVRYYITAKIDIAWYMDPLTRAAFSVAPRLSADVITSSPVAIPEVTKAIFPGCYLPPFCCHYQCACFELTCLEKKGEVTLSGSLDRLHGAPGEAVGVSATASNNMDKPVHLLVRMVCWLKLYAEGMTAGGRVPYIDPVATQNWQQYKQQNPDAGDLFIKGTPLLKVEIPAGAQNVQIKDQQVIIPMVEASYHGGYLVNQQWTQILNQYGMRNERYWRRKRMDAMTWGYQLVLELDVPDTKFDLTKVFPFIVCSIPKAPSIQPAMVVDAVPCSLADEGTATSAFDGWYSQQLPLTAMAAINVEAVLAPDADTGLPPVAFQPVVTAPNPYGGPQYRYDGGGVERVRGAVLADTYQPMIPVATAVVVPLGDAGGGGGAMAYGSNVPLCAGSVPSNQVMTGRV